MRIYFLLMLLAYLGGNIYIFVRGLQAVQHLPSVFKWLWSVFFWLSFLAIIPAFAMRNTRIATAAGWHVFYEYASSWLVVTLYMGLLLLCFDAFRLFHHPFRYGFAISLALTVGLLIYGHYRYQHPACTVVDVEVDRPSTGRTQTLKIAGVSDVHLGMGTNKKRLQKYVRLINAQNPDIILIAGDLIDSSITPVRRGRMEEELRQLRAPLGIYMSPGNHEYISGIDGSRDYISGSTGIRFLRDSVATLPNGLRIVGRDDVSNPSRKELRTLLEGAAGDGPVIVLDHQPYELRQAEEAGADLLFCGHTHHGQVWPMSWITERMFDVAYGFAKRGNTSVYVSSGLSLWGPPFRIGTKSELVVFNLRFKSRT
ncbi:MAG: metallophosphoesterase [Tannerella sp.]|jgi:predicted MPP superfamily phosphohydrolase|nr:metallophosphoesterase [Tannerella sp.]